MNEIRALLGLHCCRQPGPNGIGELVGVPGWHPLVRASFPTLLEPTLVELAPYVPEARIVDSSATDPPVCALYEREDDHAHRTLLVLMEAVARGHGWEERPWSTLIADHEVGLARHMYEAIVAKMGGTVADVFGRG